MQLTCQMKVSKDGFIHNTRKTDMHAAVLEKGNTYNSLLMLSSIHESECNEI